MLASARFCLSVGNSASKTHSGARTPRVLTTKTRDRLGCPGGSITVVLFLGAGGSVLPVRSLPLRSRAGVLIAKQRCSRAPRRVVTEPFLELISAGSPPEVSKAPGGSFLPPTQRIPGPFRQSRGSGTRKGGWAPGVPCGLLCARAPQASLTSGSASQRKVPQGAGGRRLAPGARDQS